MVTHSNEAHGLSDWFTPVWVQDVCSMAEWIGLPRMCIWTVLCSHYEATVAACRIRLVFTMSAGIFSQVCVTAVYTHTQINTHRDTCSYTVIITRFLTHSRTNWFDILFTTVAWICLYRRVWNGCSNVTKKLHLWRSKTVFNGIRICYRKVEENRGTRSQRSLLWTNCPIWVDKQQLITWGETMPSITGIFSGPKWNYI